MAEGIAIGVIIGLVIGLALGIVGVGGLALIRLEAIYGEASATCDTISRNFEAKLEQILEEPRHAPGVAEGRYPGGSSNGEVADARSDVGTEVSPAPVRPPTDTTADDARP